MRAKERSVNWWHESNMYTIGMENYEFLMTKISRETEKKINKTTFIRISPSHILGLAFEKFMSYSRILRIRNPSIFRSPRLIHTCAIRKFHTGFIWFAINFVAGLAKLTCFFYEILGTYFTKEAASWCGNRHSRWEFK